MHHAWVVTPEGKVVDPTWETLPNGLRGAAYYGVAFPIEIVSAARLTGSYSVLDNWQSGFALFRTPYVPK